MSASHTFDSLMKQKWPDLYISLYAAEDFFLAFVYLFTQIFVIVNNHAGKSEVPRKKIPNV